MENKIPLPTDSIYKFYALFGLLLFIFSLGATIYVSRSTNDLVFSSAVEYETLKSIEKPTTAEVTKRQGIEKRLEIALADKKFFLYALGALAGLGMVAMIYGFTKWHRDIQPVQDETAKLQLEKLRLEVAGLTIKVMS